MLAFASTLLHREQRLGPRAFPLTQHWENVVVIMADARFPSGSSGSSMQICGTPCCREQKPTLRPSILRLIAS
jgi:hypothetical protein